MGRYTTARSFDDRSTEVQAAPTEAEKETASKKDILEVQVRLGACGVGGCGGFARTEKRVAVLNLPSWPVGC